MTKKSAKKITDTNIVEEVKEVKKTTRKVQKQLDHSEMVCVRSVFPGTVCYRSIRTGLEVIWEGYGAEEWMTVADLLTMKASKPVFLTKPWIVVDDEEVVEYLSLGSIYNTLLELEDLDRLFSLPIEELREKIRIAPKGFKETIGDTAKKKIENDELYDNRVIKLLQEELKIEF